MKRIMLFGLLAVVVGGALALRSEPADTRACRAVTTRVARDVAGALPAAAAGRALVANTFAGSATIIDLATGERTTLDTGKDPHDAAVSPDGRWGVVSNYGPERRRTYLGAKLFVIDMERRRIARVIETGEYQGLHDVAFRPGHPTRVLVTAQTSRRLIEVDIATGRVVSAIDTRGVRSHMVAVSADGRWAFTTNEGSGTVSRLDLETGQLVSTFPASEHVEGIAVADSGRQVWVGEPARGVVTVRDAERGEVLATLDGFRYPVRIAGTPDGNSVVISDPGCRMIAIGDAATRSITRTLGMPFDPPVSVGEVAADGRTAIASINDDRAMIAFDLETGRILARHKAGWGADGVGWGPK